MRIFSISNILQSESFLRFRSFQKYGGGFCNRIPSAPIRRLSGAARPRRVALVLARVGKHQLQAVDLVDARGAGIVVDGDDVDVRVPVFDGLYHALAAVFKRGCGSIAPEAATMAWSEDNGEGSLGMTRFPSCHPIFTPIP